MSGTQSITFVTGGAGLIGSHLARYLVALARRVGMTPAAGDGES